MSADNVIDLDRPKSSLLDAISRPAARPPEAATAEPPASSIPPEESPLSAEELAPLPRTGDVYVAHSRVANRPLTTIFFLPRGGLPDGFCYSGFERVRMIEDQKPGASPGLLVRFNGSVVYEVLIEGRNLLALCNLIGRHVVYWVREHPTGRDEGGDLAAFVRRITIREIER
jgi:hypothetical protein